MKDKIMFSIEGAGQKLKTKCEKALAEKYGKNVPDLIKERFESELQNIIANGFASYYVLASMVAEKIRELGYLHNVRGCAGGSFIVYLLGISETNPLPPHYYCPECKRVEFVDAAEYPSGFDLKWSGAAQKNCPECGAELTGDGHDIPVQFFAGYEGNIVPDFDFNISPDIRQDLVKYLVEIFGEDNGILEHRYIDIIDNDMFTQLKLMEEYTGVSARSIKFESIDIFNFFYDDDFAGLPFDADFTREVSDATFPMRFDDLIKMFGLEHSTEVWKDNGEKHAKEVGNCEEIIAHREDVMQTLVRHGIERKTAFEIAEMVRRGKAGRCLSTQQEKMLSDHGIPNWYIDSMKKIKYLFPKSHAVEYYINYLRMIWYKIYHPVEFYAATLSVDTVDFDYSILAGNRFRFESELKEFTREWDGHKSDDSGKMHFFRLGEIAKGVMRKEFSLSDSDKAPEVKCGGSSELMKSGIPELDEMLHSFLDGALYVIGGRPGMGKTALMLQIALNIVASTSKPVYILSLEMSAEQIVKRMISQIVDIDQQTVFDADFTSKQKDLLGLCWSIMDAMPVYIAESFAGADLKEIKKSVKEEISDGILLIDYLQLIDATCANSVKERLNLISEGLKDLAKEVNIPIVVCSQLGRWVEYRRNPRPVLSDLRYYGRILQDADGIVFIYRNLYYFPGSSDYAELILDKNCFGPTGIAHVKFDHKRFALGGMLNALTQFSYIEGVNVRVAL